MKKIRPLYEQLGVDYYYEHYADAYENPHEPQIRQLLEQNQHRIDYTKVLDFCAGGGEVTQTLLGLGFSDMEAADPYTYQLYQKNTQRACARWDFDFLLRAPIEGKQYSAIICSFAMHLCPEYQLFTLCYNLFCMSPQLVIISPHKRPILEQYEGIRLEFLDTTPTEKGKQVFLKSYRWGE